MNARGPEQLIVYVPSAGRQWLTELAVLSAVRHSSVPLQFLVGGSQGSERERLGRLERAADVRIEIGRGRSHGEWLDHWIRSSTARHAVFLDSDVFFRRTCWVSPILAQLDAGATLVSCRIWERTTRVIEPVRGAITTSMPRPAPWLMAVDVPRLRATGASFAYTNAFIGGELVAWDVGGKVLEALRSEDLVARELPPSYGRHYRHVGGMSSRAAPKARIETRRWLRLQHARLRFLQERVTRRPEPTRHSEE